MGDYPCGKTFMAMAGQMCREYFKTKSENDETLEKNSQNFFRFPVRDIKFSDIVYKSKSLTKERFIQYSHYCLEFLGVSALIVVFLMVHLYSIYQTPGP